MDGELRRWHERPARPGLAAARHGHPPGPGAVWAVGVPCVVARRVEARAGGSDGMLEGRWDLASWVVPTLRDGLGHRRRVLLPHVEPGRSLSPHHARRFVGVWERCDALLRRCPPATFSSFHNRRSVRDIAIKDVGNHFGNCAPPSPPRSAPPGSPTARDPALHPSHHHPPRPPPSLTSPPPSPPPPYSCSWADLRIRHPLLPYSTHTTALGLGRGLRLDRRPSPYPHHHHHPCATAATSSSVVISISYHVHTRFQGPPSCRRS